MNLYLQSETDFIHNGLGFLTDVLNAKVEDNLNGDYSLVFEYKINGKLSEYLINENIVGCKVADGTKQLFIIKNVIKTFNSIQVTCKHIFYLLLDNFLEDTSPTNLSPQPFLNWILDKTNYKHTFNAYSDISTFKSARYIRRNPVDCILGDTDNSMVNLFGGEIKRDNFDIHFNKQIGNDNGVKLIVGKNITGINISVDTSLVHTRIMPQGFDGLLLPEKYIDSPLINSYANPKICKIEFSDVRYDAEDESAYNTQEEAYDALRNEVQKLFDNGIDKPVINVKVDWIELSKTNEYKEYSNLEKVSLGDTITIDLLGVSYKSRIIKTIYNPLTDRIETFEIGTPKANIGTSTNNIQKQLEKIDPISILENAKKNATEMLTKAMGGYVYKTQNELFIMDTNDVTTATKVWRWNLNGLGYSSNGINGPYETAITQDGKIVADFITTGKLDTSVIEGYDSLLTTVKDTKTEITDLKTLKDTINGNNEINVLDALEANAIEYRVEGKSEQNEIPTPSNPQGIKSIKGIHNYFKLADSQTKNGITFTKNTDGSFDITGTATAKTTFVVSESADNIPNGTWTMASNIKLSNGSFAVFEEWQNNTWLKTITSLDTNHQTSVKYGHNKSGNKVVYYVGVEANITVDLHNVKIQLEHSDKIHGFTPSGKYLKIVNNSENLYNVNDRNQLTNATVNEDGWITATIDNTNGSNTTYASIFTSPSGLLKPNTYYNLVTEIKEVSGNINQFVISNNWDGVRSQIKNYVIYNILNAHQIKISKVKSTLNLEEPTLLRSDIGVAAGNTATITFRISLLDYDENLTVENFEYKSYEQKEILVPLGDNFIGSLNDVKDELEIINNKVILHKRTDKVVLNGTENWYLDNIIGNCEMRSFYTTILQNIVVNDSNILSNYFVNNVNVYNTDEIGAYINWMGSLRLKVSSDIDTIDKLKSWLSNNNVEVLYQLAEPYDIDLEQVSVPLRQGYNKLTLVEDLEANTSATYLKDNVLNQEYARQLDLDITNDNLNSTKNDINSLNTDVHNNYQELLGKINALPSNDIITQITNRVEETVTSTEWAVNRIQDITINGVSQVNTGNGMTFNDDGLNFDRVGAPVGSSVDEAGMKIVDKTGANNEVIQYTGYVNKEIASEVPALAKSEGSVVNYAKEYFFDERIRGRYTQLDETQDEELGYGCEFKFGGEE